MPGQLLADPVDLLGPVVEFGDEGQRLRRIPREDRVREREHLLPPGNPGGVGHHLGGDLRFGGHALVEEGERVPHPAVGKPGNQPGGVFLGNPLFPGDVKEPLGAVLRPDPAEVVPLAAGDNRRRDLVGLGGREDKEDVGRRLFHDL